jgi:hypothetical protein
MTTYYMESNQNLSEMIKEDDDKRRAMMQYIQREWMRSGMDIHDFADDLLNAAHHFKETALYNELNV